MKPSTQDRTEGKVHEVKGRIKEEVGKVTNDPNLEVNGNTESPTRVREWRGGIPSQSLKTRVGKR